MTEKSRGIAAIIYLSACILLGGASAAGAIANGVLQLAAVVLIVVSLWSLRKPVFPAEASGLLWVVGLFVLVVALYLVPLPPSLWEQLPGRAATARGFALLGVDLPWLPVSLAPQRSASSLLSLLPPAALFLLVTQISGRWRRRLGWVVLSAASLSIALSAFQLLGGPQSPLRFYQITNPNRAVGFFSSANHLPTLILCALPFTGLLAARAIASRTTQGKGGGLTLSTSLALFLAVGIGFSGSVAGYGLFLPAALGTFLIYRRAVVGRLSASWAAAVAALFLVFVAIASAGPLNQQALSDKFSEHPTSRKSIWDTSTRAALKLSPVGSGLGTFSTIYRTFDDPGRASKEFVNHAHNDYLELVLELGVPGLLIILGFLLWWGRRSFRAWREDFRGADLARAASVIIGVLLLHSAVDYPLRTAALAAIFAMACAFLVAPPARRARASANQANSGPRHLEAD